MVRRSQPRSYRAWAGGGVLAALVLAMAIAAVRVQYIPSEAVSLSIAFVDLIRSGDIAKAHELTTKDGGVGRDLAAFTDKVDREWGGHDGDRGPADRGPAEVRDVRPFQSYGNRLRRWISGRSMDAAETSLDLSVGGLPFEVRVVHLRGGGWRVRYFQGHAA
jgi:hypothetical protein